MVNIQFEPNLSHQTAAVDAVVRIFEGAPYTRPEEKFWTGEVSSNLLAISAEKIKENVASLADDQGIEDYGPTDEPDFSVEMETGTGKTYVYIRTIFQLHKQYGLHKFMIVVPSVAIREGVMATLRDTLQHFRAMYGEVAQVIEYSSKRLPDVRSFCVTNHLSILVINTQAFASDATIINAEDRDSGNIREQIQQAQPIIIMDEPQEGMDTENMKKRIAAFNPLFKLRYSATHKHPKNVVHRLTPYDAYNSGLVKKVAVLSIHETNTQSNVAIKFRKVNLRSGRDPTASLTLNVRLTDGEIREKAVTVKMGDDLMRKTNNPVYEGWVVEDVGTTDVFDGEGWIKFTNGEQTSEGGTFGSDKTEIFRQQIHRTIQNHFRRKKQLVPLGIKPLVLFFIDRVANYIEPEGLIRQLFIEEYTALYRQEHGEEPANAETVHGGYFAQTSKGEFTDNAKSMEGEGSKAIYDKILKNKAQLLSLDDPLEFIFSHSALGVGWDNPNVFTICTLNESISQIKKRQEIGRGLRLCVQQNGKRYHDTEDTKEGSEVNLLTVVPNESYHAFVATYQIELQEELGASGKLPKIRDDNKAPIQITRSEDRFSSDDFAELWRKIAQRTKCKIHFREENLVEKGIEALSDIAVRKNEVEVSLHKWASITEGEEGVEIEEDNSYSRNSRASIHGTQATLDVIGELSRDTSLATATIAEILAELTPAQQTMLSSNPMKFMAEAAKKLRRIVGQELVRLVRYEKTNDTISMDELFPEIDETTREVTPTPKRGLYDHIIHDSNVESRIAADFDEQSTVRLFLKLPSGYKISTPIGNYTPDFALVMEKRELFDDKSDGKKFYFVVETKGTSDIDQLKPDERMKIECAIKHFEALGVAEYLPSVKDIESFDEKSFNAVRETFFNQ